MGLRIVTWNVNGIRNPFSYEPWRSKRSFASMFDILEADIAIFQETKIQRKDLKDDMVLVPGWDCFFSFPGREKGKFGVVIYTRQSTCAPIRAEEGLTGTLSGSSSDIPFRELPESQQIGGYPTEVQMIQAPGAPDIAADFDALDSEGRVVILEFPAFVLFGVYAPASRDETRVAYRAGFFNLLDARIRNLIKLGKRVILTGDLNVSKEPLDVANIEADLRKSGTTIEEYFGTASRRMFNHLVIGGTVFGEKDSTREEQVLWDVCRSFHADREGMYTHWETKKNARPANYGSRIDYILCSQDMKDWFCESNIQEGLMGSDHCPVYAIMKDQIEIDGKLTHTLDAMNPRGMFRDGKRLREHSSKDMLPASGRLIPDFTGRQSIRDMFTKRPSLQAKSTSFMNDPDNLEKEISLCVGSGTPKRVAEVEGSSTALASRSTPPQKPPEPAATRSSLKRSFTDKTIGLKSAKKPKGGGTASGSGSPAKGQSQISGFFKPKTTSAKPTPQAVPPSMSGVTTSAMHTEITDDMPPHSEPGEFCVEDHHVTSGKVDPTSPYAAGSSFGAAQPPRPTEDPARDLEESKEGWAKLFSKRQVPLCEHGEPCKQMLSKKQGQNYMRWFYMCARPLGPSGDKEKATQWRCRSFVWSSQISQ